MAKGAFRVSRTIYGCVGLAKAYVVEGINTVVIKEEKDGKLIHPGIYEVHSDDIKTCKLQKFGNYPEQYLVPVRYLKKRQTA